MSVASKTKVAGEVVGVGALATTALTAISLYTYHAKDPSFNSYLSDGTKVANAAGIVGASLADLLVQAVGGIGWIAPVALLYVGVALVRGGRSLPMLGSIASAALLMTALAGLAHIYYGHDPLFGTPVAGGMLGALVAGKLTTPWLATVGSTIALSAVALVALLTMFRLSLADLTDKAGLGLLFVGRKIGGGAKVVGGGVVAAGSALAKVKIPLFLDTQESKSIREKKRRIREKGEIDPFDEVDEPIGAPLPSLSLSDNDAVTGDEFDDIAIADVFGEPFDDDLTLPPPKIIGELDDDPTLPPGRSLDHGGEEGGRPPTKTRDKKKKKSTEEEFQQEIFSAAAEARYEKPSIKLLDSNTGPRVRQNNDDLIKASRALERKLKDFGIDGRVTQVLPGPVITIFEFEPAPGVKVSKIVSLADDLAMSLRALSIRIMAPIPGKSVVGVEVPNATREAVFLKDIFEEEVFVEGEDILPLALGKDVSGRPVIIDLVKVPHLLIAGSTGSGKSVGINAMICSVLYRRTPEEVKFIMVDPKMLELSIYDGIPHLIAPVVTHAKKAANALKWVVGEMERRYALLADLGVRNIGGYNRLAEKNLKEMARKGIGPSDLPREFAEDGVEIKPHTRDTVCEKLPYIVVVIDELADLMMVASKEVEDSLARLAQMARASGIHLIVATQRPSVDVLTGLIKANFPARVSFQVRSRTDSRTILDSMGAEKLLGRGDMLYLPPGASALQRIQGPFVSDEEIHRVVNFLKGQSQPEYNDDILKAASDDGVEGVSEEDMDEFYDQAVELVARTKQASISMIQRKLRIGYNRAARIVEVMEQQGLVGPSDGAKPREVYVRPPEDVETTYNM